MEQDNWKYMDLKVKSVTPFASIGKDTVALNSLLSQKYNLDKFSRVSPLLSENTQKIGLQFHNNRTKGLSLYNCRGQRCFSARKLNNNSWVAKISSLPPNQRHFKVTYNKVKKMLVIDLKNT